MRTRTSPRNQERLWRYLTRPIAPQPKAETPILSDAEVDAMYPFWSKQSRNMLKRDMAKRRAEGR